MKIAKRRRSKAVTHHGAEFARDMLAVMERLHRERYPHIPFAVADGTAEALADGYVSVKNTPSKPFR